MLLPPPAPSPPSPPLPLHPPPRPPAQNRKGKEVISTGSGSPAEKLSSSEGAAGFLELETKSKPGPRARAAPTAPGPQLPSVCVTSLIQQNTCPAVATLQAAGELWGAPGLAPGCPQAQGVGLEPGCQGGWLYSSPSHPAVGLCHGTDLMPGILPRKVAPECPLEQEPFPSPHLNLFRTSFRTAAWGLPPALAGR